MCLERCVVCVVWIEGMLIIVEWRWGWNGSLSFFGNGRDFFFWWWKRFRVDVVCFLRSLFLMMFFLFFCLFGGLDLNFKVEKIFWWLVFEEIDVFVGLNVDLCLDFWLVWLMNFFFFCFMLLIYLFR